MSRSGFAPMVDRLGEFWQAAPSSSISGTLRSRPIALLAFSKQCLSGFEVHDRFKQQQSGTLVPKCYGSLGGTDFTVYPHVQFFVLLVPIGCGAVIIVVQYSCTRHHICGGGTCRAGCPCPP